MDTLNFLTAGVPVMAKSYEKACDSLRELGLDGFEIEFVHGVRMNPDTQDKLKETKKDLIFTAHSPYYINLNAIEEEKVEASIKRIIDTANMAKSLGGYSIVYHAGFYLGKGKEETYSQIFNCHKKITEILEKENNNIWIRPETTGKKTQWGDLDEVIKLSKEFKNVLPCVDFAHLHARSGGEFNTYDEFCYVFEKIGKELGEVALKNFHAHIAGIAYSDKGEKHHLVFDQADMNYKDFLKAVKSFDIKGVIICESPNVEIDCKILKQHFLTL